MGSEAVDEGPAAFAGVKNRPVLGVSLTANSVATSAIGQESRPAAIVAQRAAAPLAPSAPA